MSQNFKRNGSSCSAVGCTMRRGTNFLSQIKMFSFPADPVRRAVWCNALKRKNWFPTNNSLICNAHFISGKPSLDPEHPDYVPSLFSFKKRAAEKGEKSIQRYERNVKRRRNVVHFEESQYEQHRADNLKKLKPNAIPTLFDFSNPHSVLASKHKRGKGMPMSVSVLDRTTLDHGEVCSLHFQESDFERETSAYDPKTGRTLTAPLGIVRLKKGAVPSFDVTGPYISLDKTDQDKIIFGNEQFAPGLQDLTSSEPENIHLANILKSNISLQSENSDKMKKKPGRRKRKGQSEITVTDEVGSSSLKSCLNINPNTSSHNFNEKSSQCTPTVSIKVEKPWQEEYNYVEKASVDKSKDCGKLQIEIKDVRSVSSGISLKADKNKTEISENSSTSARPLKILKREEIFGKLVSSELSDLCKNPELYLKTKQAILDILVKAHYEQIKCSGSVL